MPKFLILTHPVEPPPDSQFKRVSACISYWGEVHRAGKAKVYPIAGRKGYAIIADVKDHDELIELIYGNPMAYDESCEIYPLGSFEAEEKMVNQLLRKVLPTLEKSTP